MNRFKTPLYKMGISKQRFIQILFEMSKQHTTVESEGNMNQCLLDFEL